jgi:hypothetical protein
MIYFDTYYGMQSIRNVTIWVAAAQGSEEALATLGAHYFGGNDPDAFQLTTEQIDAIVGTNSLLQSWIS